MPIINKKSIKKHITKKKKSWSIARWHKEAKVAFQKYVRLRDANDQGDVKCVTCPKVGKWNDNFDGGHFIRAGNRSICFDERNCHSQCKGCNNYGNGQWERYALFIKDRYGLDTLEFLLSQTGVECLRSKIELEEIKNKYLLMAKEEAKRKNILL